MSETVAAIHKPVVMPFADSVPRSQDVRTECSSALNLQLFRSLAPDIAREGLRRVRLLGSKRAQVFSVRGEGHLAVMDAFPRNCQAIHGRQLYIISNVLSRRTLVLDRTEPGWVLCLPLLDTKGYLRGVLYGENSQGALDAQELEAFLEWVEHPQAAPLVETRQRVEAFAGRVKATSFVTILTSLSVMSSAGLTLHRALRHLGQYSEDAQGASLCRALAEQIEGGVSLSRAASQYPEVFTPMHLGMLKIAEETGTMDSTLAQLAVFEEKKLATSRRIKSSLGYPLFLLVACFIALLAAPPFVLEGHFQLMRDLRVDPPALTRALMDFSAFMRTPWPYLLLAGAARSLWLGWEKLSRSPERLLGATEMALKVPKLGNLLGVFLTTRFARALSVQLAAGVRPTEALKTAGSATGSPYMARLGIDAAQAISAGQSFTASLQDTGFFSPLFVSIVHTGEQVGELAPLTRWLAENCEQDLENTIEKVVSLIEPCVMVSMGLVVGTMVLATLLPLSNALANI